MKFSTAAVLGLAHCIVAMPWSTSNSKSKVLSVNEDITLSIKVSPGAARVVDPPLAKYDICWAACFSDEPHCPDSWYQKQFV
ncbi:hypothetical protein FDECE_3731 [Fusarium decemcellulare]|nr:hypothetical protein FDECE_3731 [Fusarium decemcellulare]